MGQWTSHSYLWRLPGALRFWLPPVKKAYFVGRREGLGRGTCVGELARARVGCIPAPGPGSPPGPGPPGRSRVLDRRRVPGRRWPWSRRLMKVLANRSSVGSIMDSDGRDSEVTGCAMVETDSLSGSPRHPCLAGHVNCDHEESNIDAYSTRALFVPDEAPVSSKCDAAPIGHFTIAATGQSRGLTCRCFARPPHHPAAAERPCRSWGNIGFKCCRAKCWLWRLQLRRGGGGVHVRTLMKGVVSEVDFFAFIRLAL
jgi:hypothetical protein